VGNLKIIKEIADAKGMKLKWIAKTIGISEGGLQLIISTGKGRTETLQKIADILQVQLTEITGSEHNLDILKDLPAHYKPTRSLNDISEIDYLQQVVRDKERIIELLEKQLSDCEKQLNKGQNDRKSKLA